MTNEAVMIRTKGGSFADRAIERTREKMYQRLAAFAPLDELESVLDVGVTADQELDSSNFFENRYPHSDRLTALSDQDASWLSERHRGMKFVQASALDMPFADQSFDLVFSNAVIEHVGNSDHQRRFLSECFRVAKRFVFITTPNRYHPIEFHTVLPLIHWLPKRAHRAVLKRLKMEFFAKEENLNLLSKGELIELANQANAVNKTSAHDDLLSLSLSLSLSRRRSFWASRRICCSLGRGKR
ncbi:hypothetical protein AGMMS50229_16850 [Campylobacterota bacterium]|nr:hypothetical protein AGMMS50229_16850 [Campylobacterota bacterium]